MELPQSRPFETKGRKPTHDFLSLCSHSNIHTDPKPTTPSSQGSYLKTQDFLQPLECVGANQEVNRIDTITTASEKSPLQHVLPGGIGTYTISPISYFHHNHQRVPKPELSSPMMFSGSQASGGNESNIVDGNANGYTLWGECGFGKKGQTGKERTTMRVDLKGSDKDQKLNTPRSKHSATEQRRRGKINDRLLRLRQLIPNSDQKRDKASFLLEVIEYIQFLVEKANTYETSYEGWNHEPEKRNNQQVVPEGTVSVTPKLEEEKNNIPVSVLAAAQGIDIDHPATATTQFHTRVASSETIQLSPSSQEQAQPVKEEEEEDNEEVLEGNISVSSVYSQGLVKTLREALEDSGVDLTKANISVEIKLSKQSSSSFKEHLNQTRKPKRLKTGQ